MSRTKDKVIEDLNKRLDYKDKLIKKLYLSLSLTGFLLSIFMFLLLPVSHSLFHYFIMLFDFLSGYYFLDRFRKV